MFFFQSLLLATAFAQETSDGSESTKSNSNTTISEQKSSVTKVQNDSSSNAKEYQTPTPESEEEELNPITLDVVSTTKEIVGETVASQSTIPVWHFGPDIYLSANLATSYAAAASKRDQSDFVPVSPIDLMELDMTIKGSGSIEGCSKTNMSTARLKKLSQELDMALAYYELDLAKEKFVKAEGGLLCLNAILDTDIVSRLYFLQGLLEYHSGDSVASQEAFRNAIRFTANLNWDDMFAPDSQHLFDAAKKELSSASGVPLKVYPERAKDLLWVNGIPASDETELSLHFGDNMLQFEGVEMENAKILVDSNATEITLVVPAALDKEVIDWVNTIEHQNDVGIIAKAIYPIGYELYALKDGLMYSTILSDAPIQWTQNDIPTLTQVFGVNTRSTIGRFLFWTGSALTTAGGLYTVNQASVAMNAVEVAGTNEASWDVFNQQSTVYDQASDRYQSGVIVTSSGALLTGLGYWLQQ